MKNRLLCSFAARVLAAISAILLLIPSSSFASTTTTLLTQSFSGASFPPTGWTCNYVGKNTYYGGWYHSTGGNGGTGGTYGSAVAWTYNAYQPNCSSSYTGTITMTSPAITTSSFTSADSMFVDFDLWFPYNYYESNYGSSYNKLKMQVMVGTKVLTTQTNNQDFYTGTTSYTDPTSYTASSYWKHYHIAVPFTSTTTSITFQVGDNNSTCEWGYMYDENVAISNVVVTDVHYNVLATNGPAALSFGNTPYLQAGGPYYSDFANTSSVPISMSNFTIAGANPNDYSIVHKPGTIPAGGKDSIGVTYTPHSGGASSATLSYATNADIPATGSIGLSGYGLQATVSLPFNFTAMFLGNRVRFNTTDRGTLIITNSGRAALHIASTTNITGDYPGMYSLIRIPPAIAPGQSDSIVINFSPQAEGLMDAVLTINSDASNPQVTVPLSAIGIVPHLTVTANLPSAELSNINREMVVSFDSVNLGIDSCLAITVSNTGSDTLAIEKNYFSSADVDFALTRLTGIDTLIAPGASQTITACFMPVQRGFRTATLRLETNLPPTYATPSLDTSQFAVQFIGTGVPTGELTISGSGAGTVPVGRSACVTDTFWNNGGEAVTVTAVTISGTNASAFDGTYPALPFTLAPGTNQTFTLCASPTDTGTEIGILTAEATTGASQKTATLALSVYGTSQRDTVTIAKPFATLTCEPETDTATIAVTNTGNIPTPYSASISGADAKDFTILSPVTSPTEQAGGVATYTVLFTPSTNGSENATLAITGGTGGSIALAAVGGAARIAGFGTASTAMVGSPVTFTATLNNTGTCEWTPGDATVNAPFHYVSGGTTPIAPNGTGTLTFTFDPIASGSYSSPVTFGNPTGVSVPAASVNVSGVAEAADVAEASSANGYALGQAYPNPSLGLSAMELTVPTSGVVLLTIVDLNGNLAETVLDRFMDAGTYNMSLDASTLAAGTYYCRLAANGTTLAREITIVK